ncbi:MAG TPA: GNAT family N-acetyltransferase [Pseudobdellovibrionaceae bacterium]|nr:GNAT family N-acetyltransferase [Pseudobdellovibrionaceae bacterium]
MFLESAKSVRVEVLTRDNWRTWATALAELESMIEYPYGADHFRIDHGKDYWRFFARLGEPRMHAIVRGGRILAVACGVLRSLPDGPAWYLCDLKAAPDFRGQHAATRMLRHQFFRSYWRCGRGYAISMHPAQGENRIVRLLKKFSWLPFRVEAELAFYTFSFEEIQNFRGVLEASLGELGVLDLRGVKDLIMRSTGRSMPLVHVQHGPMREAEWRPTPGVEHMLAVMEGSVTDQELKGLGRVASARACVIAHRMRGTDFSFVLSSDI